MGGGIGGRQYWEGRYGGGGDDCTACTASSFTACSATSHTRLVQRSPNGLIMAMQFSLASVRVYGCQNEAAVRMKFLSKIKLLC